MMRVDAKSLAAHGMANINMLAILIGYGQPEMRAFDVSNIVEVFERLNIFDECMRQFVN